MKTSKLLLALCMVLSLSAGVVAQTPGAAQVARGAPPALDAQGNESSGGSPRYSWENVPVPLLRSTPVSFKLPSGAVHWYEVVYLPEGGVNWVQAKVLAEKAGGYLVSLHSEAENDFVFNLIKDPKFWFKWDASHNYVMSGPFIGAFQPAGAAEPLGGWKWVSGEEWTFAKWAQDGIEGDRDPRPNTQPNDATGNQNVAAYGEVNDPVKYWGDFPHKFGSYKDTHPGAAYGFIIEYNAKP